MSDLITKLEAAAEGSRELDAEIHAALFGGVAGHTLQGVRYATHRGYGAGTVFCPARPSVVWVEDAKKAPTYTTSIDAALALIERAGQDVLTIMNEALEDLSASGYRLDQPMGPQIAQALGLALLRALPDQQEPS